MTKLNFTLESTDGRRPVAFDVSNFVIAGWAGRDREATEHHIRELEAIGVARPAATPTFYRVAATRLTTAEFIEDVGTAGSGEVEPLLIAKDGKLYVGVGSDHTDRKVETYGVTVSKQICDKPVASTVWPVEEVADHWDDLILRSYAVIDGARVLYQEGALSGLLAPKELIAGWAQNDSLPDGTAMFGGTMPAIGGVRPAARFEGELEDPVLQRRIAFGYDVKTLPIAG